MFNSSDPALNAAMFVAACMMAIILFVAGAVIMAPLALVGGLGYLAYRSREQRRIAGPPTAELVSAATVTTLPPTMEYLEGYGRHLYRTLDGNISTPVLAAILDVVKALYEAEYLGDLPSAPPPGTIAEARYRDMLIERARKIGEAQKTLDLATAAFTALGITVAARLPRTQSETSDAAVPTVPVVDLIHHPASLVMDVCKPFFDERLKSLGLFDGLRRQIDANFNANDSLSEFKGTSRQLLRAYLHNTPLLDLFETQVPFVIPRQRYAEHGALFAKSGHGKTQTLRAMIAAFLEEDDPPALIIIDSMGGLIDGIDELEIFAGRLRDRIVILDPRDADPPALNFFKLQGGSQAKRMELFFYLFKAIEQGLTPRQATMVSYLVELMQAIPNATLDTLREVCESKSQLYAAELATLPQITRDFFSQQFYGGKDPFIAQAKTQIAQRLYTIGRYQIFNRMFSAHENKFDAYDCIQKKKIVLVNTDRNALGDDGSAVFGRFILAQCLAAALQRPKHERHLALLVVDEAKAYLDDQAEKILSDARQFGLGLLLATQFPHQLQEGVKREINTNTSIKMMGPVEYAVAAQYARDMHTSPEFIMSMRAYERSHTEWACFVQNLTDAAIKLSVPFGALEEMPRMDRRTHAALRAANRVTYGAAPVASPAPQSRSAAATEPHTLESEIEPRTTAKKSAEQRGTDSSRADFDTDH